MTYSEPETIGIREKVRRQYNRFRRDKSRDSSKHAQAAQSVPTKHASSPQQVNHPQHKDVTRESIDTGNNTALPTPQLDCDEEDLKAEDLLLGNEIENGSATSDVWSAAYREAVESLGEDITAALAGKNASQLFMDLEKIELDKTHESAFLRGVKRLHSLKLPLENLKLALDLASPLANLETTAFTVCGVARSVTAIAITFANADLEFAKQIADMLKRISFIDECDTLGRKVGRKDIHKALVSVYRKMLEFYDAALTILKRKGAKLTSADELQKVIQKATIDILEDIRKMLYAQEFGQWLGLEKLSRQSQFRAELQGLRANEACKFLLKSYNFNRWYCTSESQQLVILGDMGHGKTFAMTFVADELSQRNKFLLPRPALCQYYCRDDETGKLTAILSALVYSLLNQLEGLQKPFFESYKQAQMSDFDPASNTQTMKALLQNMLNMIDRPVIFVIDGIDECDDESRSSLLEFLNSASQMTSGLKTIISTRPRESILEQLSHVNKIKLGCDPERDLIIVEKSLERLPHLSSDVKALVREKLSQQAQGSAIWTKMIIELIKARRIAAKPAMERFLMEIPFPEKLSDVYMSLFSRCTSDDPENRRLAAAALKILATSHRPLSILELAWAVALSLAENVTTVEFLGSLVDHQRVMELIYPFIASLDHNKLGLPQVRLTHQSVREWIFKDFDSKIPGSKETDQMNHKSENPNSLMLNICIKYLLLEEIGNTHIFSEDQAALQELPPCPTLFSDEEDSIQYDGNCTWESWEDDMVRFDPVERGFGELFVYASCHWLDHFSRITVESLPSLAIIENVCEAGSIRLSNWVEQNRRPACAMLPRFEFDYRLFDPLSITLVYGSVAAMHDMLGKTNLDSNRYLEGSVMKAADQILQWGDISRLRTLFLDERAGPQLQNLDLFRIVITRWQKSQRTIKPSSTEGQNWDIVFDLVYDLLDKLIEEHWGNELLCLAAGAGCIALVQRLLTSTQNNAELRKELFRGNSSFDKSTHQSIGRAVLGNHIDTVRYLLSDNDIETHLRYRNSLGENVLHLASRLCNPEMFRLLVPRFQEGVIEEDDQGDTPLARIIMSPAASASLAL
ncbi:hypothetical protein N7466_003935 [Penicillium verhagenii]|uniref:uncharacterized protein n=1 Tax=Penicillium verhagenii TaxID=1562060 RepID=UPI00254505CF|nr:uncharacterized protein N7466_003935 [Penicillium verhagenii]KAJ5934388.1 hypothetical protein N7466_003935 [Penicillium verhagenii]